MASRRTSIALARLASGAHLTKPDFDFPSKTVNLSHKSDLFLPFLEIRLVDTDGIQPNSVIIVRSLKAAKKFINSFRDTEMRVIDENSMRRSWITLAVRNGSEVRFRVERYDGA
ncbi:hypothetical protein G7Y89_g15229 [Cudoniella acicularis]|uniref:Uncharacterized protein n=1 Tax=Cudoniella acicularis TaxID=354080 RepID=A0A8H4QRI6_9HELO|nr:hypothetical protein G7Y89_g15229 [Cudoniella acicularis]